MVMNILRNHDMSYDTVTNWMPMYMEGINKKNSKLVSMQIFWKNAVGTLNGFINVYVTNNIEGKGLSATYNINTASNTNNSILVELDSVFSFIKIEYAKNQITGGQLNAILNYVEV